MGHTRVGVLPETRRWQDVHDLVYDGADADSVARATLRAASSVFGDADKSTYGRLAEEPGAVWACWLLMTLPTIAHEGSRAAPNAVSALSVDAWNDPLRFIAEAGELVRVAARQEQSGNLSELALSAFRETLAKVLLPTQTSLLDKSANDTRRRLAEFRTNRGFARLSVTFFGALLARSVLYFLSKEWPQQIGAESRFKSFNDVRLFEDDVAVWARERGQIADKFAGAWLSKHRFEKGQPTRRDAKRFLAYALAKVGSEVRAHDKSR
jgi:hypothetical protein